MPNIIQIPRILQIEIIQRTFEEISPNYHDETTFQYILWSSLKANKFFLINGRLKYSIDIMMTNLKTTSIVHRFAWKRRSIIIWMFVIVSFVEGKGCPAECYCLGNFVQCNDLQLITAPSELPSWTKVLELSGNKLGDNFTIALSKLLHLHELKLDKNQLTRIPTLRAVKNLTRLDLSHNLISEINGIDIEGLIKLEILKLDGNKLTKIQKGNFLDPCPLKQLYLQNNQIGMIENGSLDNLTSLEKLRLSNNSITDIKNVFKNLKNLRVLNMNKNDLQQISTVPFLGLNNLEKLNLKRNKIDTLDGGAFGLLKNLILLQLDFNLLTMIKRGDLFQLERLQTITLSHNNINKIESQVWEFSKEIKKLDLSFNQMTSIDHDTFEQLQKLEKLELDHNLISHISDDAFKWTPHLKILKLNSNFITRLVEDKNGVFVPLKRLFKLSLAHNAIQFVSNHTFTGLINLSELDLTENNITNIEKDAFVPMASLNRLQINSRALVCDCQLQWLSIWLQKQSKIAPMKNNDIQLFCDYPRELKGKPLAQLHHLNSTCDKFPKPIIIEEPKSQMSIKGSNVTLSCRASSTSDTPLKFLWKHNEEELMNEQIQTNNGSLEHGVVQGSSILYLTNVTYKNAGKYQCIVSNTYGNTYSSKAEINILIYPSFSKIPNDIEVTAGKTVRLECSAKGEPPPQIAWQKDGGSDFPAARERRMRVMPTDDILMILNVKTTDSGIYFCTARNLAGVIIANATLTILELPSFVKPMENKEITVGHSIVLECMAGGSPKPKLSWRKNGNPLQTTERHFFTAENQLLIIVNTTVNDGGSYECEMSNSEGSVNGISHLTVNPAPHIYDYEILALIIITVVCCAIGTLLVWFIIIYHARRRLNVSSNIDTLPTTTVFPVVPGHQMHLYLDTSSQHSKDSGTGDSTNPSNDQLQFCLPEEIVSRSTNNEEETGTINIDDPLLRYTNHERQAEVEENDYASS